MTCNPLICTALGLAFGLFSEATDAQNAQCTLVTGSKAGQVVPVTINPAPPLNASCSVGSDSGYISRTSAATNVGCQCTLFTGPNAGKAFPYDGALPLAKACKVGADTGYISRTSLNETYNEIFGGQITPHHASSQDPNFVVYRSGQRPNMECPVHFGVRLPGRRRCLPSRGGGRACLQVGGPLSDWPW